MLCLASKTDPRWVEFATRHVDEILVDHAHCEHKAAVTALSFVSKYPGDPVLVEQLSALAAEEATHLYRVARLCHARGLTLGHPGKDPYVKALLSYCRSDCVGRRTDRLLVCAIVEARSCERLKLLAAHLSDPDLRTFYDELWRCEAGHYSLFVRLAERSSDGPVQDRLDELCKKEAALLHALPIRAAIH